MQTMVNLEKLDKNMNMLRNFIGHRQRMVVADYIKGEEGDYYIDKMNEIAEVINNDNSTTNNYNIIVFNSEDNFINEDLIEKIKQQIKNGVDNVTTFNNCSRDIMEDKRNQCVKKTNRKLKISKVHVGDGKWISKSDKEVYPILAYCLRIFPLYEV